MQGNLAALFDLPLDILYEVGRHPASIQAAVADTNTADIKQHAPHRPPLDLQSHKNPAAHPHEPLVYLDMEEELRCPSGLACRTRRPEHSSVHVFSRR